MECSVPVSVYSCVGNPPIRTSTCRDEGEFLFGATWFTGEMSCRTEVLEERTPGHLLFMDVSEYEDSLPDVILLTAGGGGVSAEHASAPTK